MKFKLPARGASREQFMFTTETRRTRRNLSLNVRDLRGAPAGIWLLRDYTRAGSGAGGVTVAILCE